MSIYDGLTIGRQGLLAQGRALQVTSNNIANINTPGYTRQRAVFTPVIPGTLTGGFPGGGGVEVKEIQRLADAAINSQLLAEQQTYSYDLTREAGLSRIEGVLQDLDGSGLSASLSRFFASLNDLANNPDDSAVRETVVQSAQTLADQIRDMDRRLAQLQTDANEAIKQLAIEVTAIASDIAAVNANIRDTEVDGGTASALRDQRDQLLQELGEKVDFTSFEKSDGTVSVFVGGGFLIVEGDASGGLSTSTTQPVALANSSFVNVFQTFDGQTNGPITSEISGGELGAHILLRDTRLEAYRDDLDEFAYTLARRINDQHISGYGLVDDTQRRLFIDPTQAADVQGPNFAAVAGAAAVININTDITSNNRHLAAGTTSIGGAGSAVSDNVNALALAALETNSAAFYAVGDSIVGAGSGAQQTLGTFLQTVSGTFGSELRSARREVAQGELALASLAERKGEVSGVSLDEEVANLVRFERAYQASARVIQTVNDLLDELFRL